MATLTIADLDNGKRDLQTVDGVANSRAASVTTRYGQQTTTLYESIRRINATGGAILANLGYFVPVDYAPGLSVTEPNFTVVGPDGKIYAAQAGALPFTTGAWNPGQWYPIQNDLNDHKLLVFGTLAEAQAAAPTLAEGQIVEVPNDARRYRIEGGEPVEERRIHFELYGYSDLRAYTGGANRIELRDPILSLKVGVGGVFFLDVSDTSTSDNGIDCIVDALGRRWKREEQGFIRPEWAGLTHTDPEADGAAFVAALEHATTNRKTLLITGSPTYYIGQAQLIFKSGARVKGNGARATRIVSSRTGAGFIAMSDPSSNVVGLVLEDFEITSAGGTSSILRLGHSITSSLADGYFKNLLLSQAVGGTALFTSFLWDCVFDNIRCQNNQTSANFSSQTNNSVFNGLYLVSSTSRVDVINCEGLVFNALDLSNMSGEGVMSLYQSQVVINSPYLEYVPTKIQVGYGSEAAGQRSTLTINGGLTSSDLDHVSFEIADGCTLNISGFRTNGKDIRVFKNPDEAWKNVTFRILTESTSYLPKSTIVEHQYNSPITLDGAWGGVRPSVEYHPGHQVWSSSAGYGVLISNELVVGKQYTLEIDASVISATEVAIRHGIALSISLPSVENQRVTLIPFIALDTSMRLEFDGAIRMHSLKLHKGLVDTPSPRIKHSVFYGPSAPSTVGWETGTVFYNTQVSAGQPSGWIKGSGVWLQMGNVA